MKEIKIDFTTVRDLDNGIDIFGLLHGATLKNESMFQLTYKNPYVETLVYERKKEYVKWRVIDSKTERNILVKVAVKEQKSPEPIMDLISAAEKWRQALYEMRSFKRQLEL